MRRTRSLVRTVVGGTAVAATVTATMLATAGQAAAQSDLAAAPAVTAQTTGSTYLVMFAQGTDGAAAVAAARAAGASVVSVDRKLGYAVVRSADPAVVGKLSAAKGVQGTARNRVIGAAPKDAKDGVERLAPGAGQRAAAADAPAAAPAEPLANRQWDMRQIGATPQNVLGILSARLPRW
jgi:hypothetical protein